MPEKEQKPKVTKFRMKQQDKGYIVSGLETVLETAKATPDSPFFKQSAVVSRLQELIDYHKK